MSYQIGIDTLHLRPGPRPAHTEYCDSEAIIRDATGGRGGGMYDPAFIAAWDIDLMFVTNDGPFGRWHEHGRTTNMGHAAYADGGTDLLQSAVSPFTDPEEVYAFDATTEYPMPDHDELVAWYERFHRSIKDKHGDCVVPGGYYKTLISGAIEAFGWDMLLLAAAEPRRFAKVLDTIHRRTLAHVRAWAETSIEAFIQHDDFVWSAGAFMDPGFYRAEIIPRYAELWRVLRQAGKKVLFCADANWIEFLDDIVEAGADGFIFEPMMPLEPVVERYGRTHVIVSSKVDCRTMAFGTIDEIRGQIDQTLELAGDCPGLVFAVGNHIPANVPLAHARFYIDHLRQHWQRETAGPTPA